MDIKLTPSEVTFLAGSFAKTNPLSPFVNNKKAPLGNEAQTLEEKGIFKDGRLSQEATDILLPLSTPERSARMVLQKPFGMFEKYTYLSAGKLTCAENYNAGEENFFSVTPLEGDSQAVVDVLDDFISHSRIKNADINITLPPAEAVTLMACVDMCRVKAIGTYLTAQSIEMTFTAEEVAAQMASPFINGLCGSLAANFGVEMPQPSTVGALLVFLEQKGCIIPRGEGVYTLAPEYRNFAGGFMFYDSLLLLEAFEIISESRIATSMELCFLSGLHDNISFSVSAEGIVIAVLSGAELRARLKETMDCPTFDVK